MFVLRGAFINPSERCLNKNLLIAYVVYGFPTRRLNQLVYEKEQRLRMMMKMHGLGDPAYWAVTYAWNLALYLAYGALFIISGSALGLQYFRKTNYGLIIITLLIFGQVRYTYVVRMGQSKSTGVALQAKYCTCSAITMLHVVCY